jgi:hypothetical protein
MAVENNLGLYDPSKVQLTIDGNIATGLDDQNFIRAERNNDQYAVKAGAYGGSVRTRNNDRSGTITVRFLQTSPMIAKLRALEKQSSTFAVVITDNNPDGDNGATAEKAWVKKPSPFSRAAKDEETYTVVFETHNLVLN